MKDKEHGDKGENEDLVDVISERMQILQKKKKDIWSCFGCSTWMMIMMMIIVAMMIENGILKT